MRAIIVPMLVALLLAPTVLACPPRVIATVQDPLPWCYDGEYGGRSV